MENIERRMTIGRPFITATEDENNVYLDGWEIPKGEATKDNDFGKRRRDIIWEMYKIWKSENPIGSVYNDKVKKNIFLNEIGVKETAAHAYVNYKNVMAFYCIDRVLTSARHIKFSDLKSNTQKKEFKGGKMSQMIAKIAAKPYFGTVNVMVGVHRNDKRTFFSVTSIDVDVDK